MIEQIDIKSESGAVALCDCFNISVACITKQYGCTAEETKENLRAS